MHCSFAVNDCESACANSFPEKIKPEKYSFFGLTQTISNLDAKQTVDQFYEDAVAKV